MRDLGARFRCRFIALLRCQVHALYGKTCIRPTTPFCAVKSAQLLNAVNNVSMAFLLLFCAVIAVLPFSPTPGSGAHGAATTRMGTGLAGGDSMHAVLQEVCLGCRVPLTLVADRPPAGQLHWWRWEGMLVAFPIVSYGFTAHQYLFQVGARRSFDQAWQRRQRS